MRIIKNVSIRIALIMLVLQLLSGIMLYPVAATGIAVTPSRLEIIDALRGGEFERNITIYNPDPELTSYTLEASGDAGLWISFFKQEDTTLPVDKVTLPGNEKIRMLVKFAIPPDAANGEHKATITVTSVPAEEAEGSSGHVVSLAAPVKVTIHVTGDQILSGVIDSINIGDTEVQYPMRIKIKFYNTGNVVATPMIAVRITSQDGTTIDQFTSSKFNIKPKQRETIPLAWDTTDEQPGDYIADISVELGDSVIEEEQLDFVILPIGTLTRSGNLIELKLVDKLSLGVPNTIQATFVNTGRIDTKAKFVGEVYYGGTLVDTPQSEELLVEVGSTELLKSYFEPDQLGEYRLKGQVLYEGKKTEEKEISFTITEGGEVKYAADNTLVGTVNPDETFDFFTISMGAIGALVIIGVIFVIWQRRRSVE